MWLMVVDAYTKEIGVIPMNTTTSEAIVNTLGKIFAQFGLPRSVEF